MTNSTVARTILPGSYAYGPTPNPEFGAIKLNAGGEGTITNSTIAGNIGSFDTTGSAINIDPNATLTLENTIVAGNRSSGDYSVSPIQVDIQGTIVSNGGNVFGQDSVDGAAASDVLGADQADLFPLVDGTPVLADNGGPTRTVALLDDPANPAIGQADPATAPNLDQRGFARDAAPDAGSFEAGADGGPGIPVLPPLPDLAEKVPVDPARINGVPLELLAPAAGAFPPEVSVFPLSAEAEQANALGYVVYDEDDRIVETKMLFEDIDAFIADAAVGNEAFTFLVEEGQRFNPFVVADGADLNPAGLLESDNDFVLLDRDGNLAGIADRRPQLFAQDDDGGLTGIEGELIFAADPRPGTPGVEPNPFGAVRTLSGIGEDNTLLIAFEDKPFDPDNDLNDLVLEVEIPGFRGVPSDDALA